MHDPGQLRLLAMIEQHGSLTGAAHALRLSPAAVTQQVARAERDWEAPLVLRGPRGASLTPAGALLARHGRAVDEHTEAAAEGLDALLGRLSLRLRVGAFQAAALHLLPPALTALRHRHPQADVSVEDLLSERGPDEVAEGRLDLAVIASWSELPDPPPHVAVHHLLRDPMVVALPDDHPLATRKLRETPLQLAELQHEAWVVIVAGTAARDQFDQATQRAAFTPRIRFQTASYAVAQALVGTGIGVALVSRLAVTRTPGIVHRDLAPPQPHRELHAVTMADTSLTPLAGVFLTLLREVAQEITTGGDVSTARPARSTPPQPHD
ncbi:LysR family transcriptional regulator [Streptomyces sp. NBC_00009]|uniref:LysR family transcriptional regulator n=1 Tax=Streptomyces sp. NBC_00009 TaxID=2975620 RepID=UPI00324C5C61